jgi:hypothetical protein
MEGIWNRCSSRLKVGVRGGELRVHLIVCVRVSVDSLLPQVYDDMMTVDKGRRLIRVEGGGGGEGE